MENWENKEMEEIDLAIPKPGCRICSNQVSGACRLVVIAGTTILTPWYALSAEYRFPHQKYKYLLLIFSYVIIFMSLIRKQRTE